MLPPVLPKLFVAFAALLALRGDPLSLHVAALTLHAVVLGLHFDALARHVLRPAVISPAKVANAKKRQPVQVDCSV